MDDREENNHSSVSGVLVSLLQGGHVQWLRMPPPLLLRVWRFFDLICNHAQLWGIQGVGMKWGVAWRNLSRYVKHDLKEIAFPSSLPNPPHFQAKPKPRKLTVKDYVDIVRTAASLHLKSFTRGGLTKEDWKKAGLDEQNDAEVAEQKEPAQPSSIEEIALAARAGAEHVKPALQRIYMTRASAYRDALKSFVEGYQEGVAEVMAKNSQAEPATSRQKSTEADEQTTRSSPAEDARKGKLPF